MSEPGVPWLRLSVGRSADVPDTTMNFTDIKQLLADEDAVSPVIGVILMVAITVILAAVIGTFVLGLGDQVQSSAPNANFEFDYDGDFTSGQTADMTVTHNGGQDVDSANLAVQVGSTTAWADVGNSGTWTVSSSDWGTSGTGVTVSTGDSLVITKPSTDDVTGDAVRVIWQSDSGGSSNTIGQSTVPS